MRVMDDERFLAAFLLAIVALGFATILF